MKIDLDEAHFRLSRALGLRTWGAKIGIGSFLTLELGNPKPRDPSAGEFLIWIYCSAWRIETSSRVVVSSEDPRKNMESNVGILDDTRLKNVIIEPPSLSASFWFHNEVVLRTFSIFSHDYEHWMFHFPDGSVLQAGPSSALTIEK